MSAFIMISSLLVAFLIGIQIGIILYVVKVCKDKSPRYKTMSGRERKKNYRELFLDGLELLSTVR